MLTKKPFQYFKFYNVINKTFINEYLLFIFLTIPLIVFWIEISIHNKSPFIVFL